VKGSKSPRVRQDVSQGCNTVEAKQFLLKRKDFEFQKEAVVYMEEVLIMELGFFELGRKSLIEILQHSKAGAREKSYTECM